jgi:hypothetical protein
MIKRYALHSVAIVVLSTICFCLVDAEKCIARQEARRAAAQAFDSAHIRHVHAFEGKAPSCCHALEARVFGEAGTAKSLSFSSPSPWAQNARYEPSQNAPSVQLSRWSE